MDSLPLNRILQFADLDGDERQRLSQLAGPRVKMAAKQVIREQGDPVEGVFLLRSGWVSAFVDLPDGTRQLVRVHLPSDVLGAPSLALHVAAESLVATTDIVVATLSFDAMGEIFRSMPRVAASLFLCANQERVILMDRLTSIGRTSSAQRLAAFLLHIHERLVAINPRQSALFEMPLTQKHLGEAIGLTTIHVNRTFRKFLDAGMVVRKGRAIELCNLPALRQLAVAPERNWRSDPGWFYNRM
jgi:CRP-like cAMP-binding protein